MVTNPNVRALVIVLATAGGAGYAPIASGTVGSLVALPLVPWIARMRDESWALGLALVVGIAGVAIWVAGRAEEIFGGKDHSRIVIDEVAGMATAALFAPATWTAAALVFVTFRVFDLVAGAYAGILTRVILEVL